MKQFLTVTALCIAPVVLASTQDTAALNKEAKAKVQMFQSNLSRRLNQA